MSANSNGGWSFHNPVRVHFGRGRRQLLIDELPGRRCLIVTTARGRRQLQSDGVLARLAEVATVTWFDEVTSNPNHAALQRATDALADQRFDVVIGFGGGSALDSAKVLAVALGQGLATRSLAELLSDPGLHAEARPLPVYAVPTTAGTGSEVTPFATVWDQALRRKLSLAGAAVYPAVAVVDPMLTDAVPADVTLSTGLDALNQAIESIWNKNATPFTIAMATHALRLGISALPRVLQQPADARARDAMAECSLLSGLAISQTRTALCHAISYPLTAHFGVPHGLACAFTMPAVLRVNLSVDDGRFVQLARDLLGPDADLPQLVGCFERLHRTLGVGHAVTAKVPSLDRLLALTSEMRQPGRANNNLAPVDDALVRRVLREAWALSAQ